MTKIDKFYDLGCDRLDEYYYGRISKCETTNDRVKLQTAADELIRGYVYALADAEVVTRDEQFVLFKRLRAFAGDLIFEVYE